jgi:hypothetical protein
VDDYTAIEKAQMFKIKYSLLCLFEDFQWVVVSG